MGWDYSPSWQRKEDIAEELHLTPGAFWIAQDGCRIRCEASKFTREHGAMVLWAAVLVDKGPACQAPGHDGFIACVLIEKRGAFGYKFMDESMGPYYYSVPPAYLNMVPCPDSETARRWRAEVSARQTVRPELHQLIEGPGPRP